MSFINLFEQWEIPTHQEVFLLIFPQELDLCPLPHLLKVAVRSQQGWLGLRMSQLLNIQNHKQKLDNIFGLSSKVILTSLSFSVK